MKIRSIKVLDEGVIRVGSSIYCFKPYISVMLKKALVCILSLDVIYQTREECFIGCPNTEKRVEKRGRRPSFLTDFEVVGYLMKHSFECLILLLKGISILRDIWAQSWPNFMLIKTTYPNFHHGSDFFCFWLMNY